MITYVISDIHGMLYHLIDALIKINEDAPRDQLTRVIFLGNYVNEGDHTSKVINLLLRGPENPNQEWIFLKGNQDQYFADAFLRGDWSLFKTFKYLPTLKSYTMEDISCCTINEKESKVIDPIIFEHAFWLDNLPYYFEDEYRYYVHSGFQPSVPIELQSRKVMLCIHDEFLKSNYNFGKMVIHGHVPTIGNAEVKSNRININGGVNIGQCLIVAKFEDENYEFWNFMRAENILWEGDKFIIKK